MSIEFSAVDPGKSKSRAKAMVFRAQDLVPLMQRKDAKPTQQYDQILESIMARIKVVASKGGTQCFYEVPRFLPGYPLLDVRACSAYLILKLRRLDFQVQYFPSGHLWIGWFHIDSTPKTVAVPPTLPVLPAPSRPSPPGLPEGGAPASTSGHDAVRHLQKIYDEASIDVLTRLAPRPPPDPKSGPFSF